MKAENQTPKLGAVLPCTSSELSCKLSGGVRSTWQSSYANWAQITWQLQPISLPHSQCSLIPYKAATCQQHLDATLEKRVLAPCTTASSQHNTRWCCHSGISTKVAVRGSRSPAPWKKELFCSKRAELELEFHHLFEYQKYLQSYSLNIFIHILYIQYSFIASVSCSCSAYIHPVLAKDRCSILRVAP